MSTVVGLVQDGKVFMGADSFATTVDGDRRHMCVEKLFVNGPYLLGFIGSVRNGQVLKPHHFTPPENVLDFPDAVMEQFRNKSCLGIQTETQTAMQEGNILIATPNGELYELLMDFQLNQIPEYTAVGSGSPFALGSLYTTRNRKDPKQRIKAALEAAARYNVATGPPFIIEEFLED